MELTTLPEQKRDRSPMLRVLRIRPGFAQQIRIVSKTPIYLLTHWTTHSVLCPGDDCPLCELRSRRACGFCVVALPDVRIYRLLEVKGRSLDSWFQVVCEDGETVKNRSMKILVRTLRSGITFMREDTRNDPDESQQHLRNGVTSIGFLAACIARLYKLPVPAIEATIAEIAELWESPIRANALSEAKQLLGT